MVNDYGIQINVGAEVQQALAQINQLESALSRLQKLMSKAGGNSATSATVSNKISNGFVQNIKGNQFNLTPAKETLELQKAILQVQRDGVQTQREVNEQALIEKQIRTQTSKEYQETRKQINEIMLQQKQATLTAQQALQSSRQQTVQERLRGVEIRNSSVEQLNAARLTQQEQRPTQTVSTSSSARADG
jgi:hypothetical protein